MDPRRAPAAKRWRRTATALATACLAAGLATAASAQLPETLAPLSDPAPTLNDKAGTDAADTPYTPIAKEPPEGLFTLVAGTRYKDPQPSPANLIEDSPTSFDSDLFAVSFRDKERGFAGGTEKQSDGTHTPVLYRYANQEWKRDQALSGAGYVAAIAWIDEDRALAVGGDGTYPDREKADGSSTCATGGDPTKDETQGAGKARAWLYEDGSWQELDRESSPGDGAELPAAMRALTALDFYLPDPADPANPKPFGIAGGLCQLWHWEDQGFLKNTATGAFEPPFGAEPTSKPLPSLIFRVRDVSFARVAHMDPALPVSERRNILAYASTSGCCYPDAGKSELADPVVLQYPSGPLIPPPPPENPFGPPGPWPLTSSNPSPARAKSWGVVANAGSTTINSTTSTPANRSRALEPDSFVSVTATQALGPVPTSGPRPVRFMEPGVIGSPAGPLPATGAEPPSTVGKTAIFGAAGAVNARQPKSVGASTVHLAAGDGDIGGGDLRMSKVGGGSGTAPNTQLPGDVPLTSLTVDEGNEPCCTIVQFATLRGAKYAGGEGRTLPDGIPDWSVGEHRAGGRAVAFATDPGQIPGPPDAVEPPPTIHLCGSLGDTWADPVHGWNGGAANVPIRTQCNAESLAPYPGQANESYNLAGRSKEHSERPAPALKSYKLLALPTYRLNAIAMLDEAGEGWAVGANGAIVRLRPDTSKATRAGEPEPPALGKPKPAPLPDLSPWAEKRPAPAGPPGIVPPLAERPFDQLAEPRMEMVHTTPGNVKRIVMSRDGQEGWAFGSMHHYAEGRWTYCDPALADEELPDRGCRQWAEFKRANPSLLAIADATRVPYENDSDPANDHEFEVVAVTSSVNAGEIIRYTPERGWALERPEWVQELAHPTGPDQVLAGARAVAFTAPDEGWILTNENARIISTTDSAWRWFRFDGQRWRACVQPNPQSSGGSDECDRERMLPKQTPRQGRITGLATAGRRLLAFGYRTPGEICAVGNVPSDATCTLGSSNRVPLVLVRDAGDAGWSRAPDRGGFDPAATSPVAALGGQVGSLAVAKRPDGRFEGWALGPFRTSATDRNDSSGVSIGTGPALLRLAPGGEWAPFEDSGVFAEYAHKCCRKENANTPQQSIPPRESPIEILPDASGAFSPAFIGRGSYKRENLSVLNTARGRWEGARGDRPLSIREGAVPVEQVGALAPDGGGGIWARLEGSEGSFHRYTSRPHKPVFGEVAPPSINLSRRLYTGLAGAPDGTVWVSTDSDTLYRYDRTVGWDAVRIAGWDPGRVVTAPSAIRAIAVGADGEGLAVGQRGRIARFGRAGAVLDPAAGRLCDSTPVPPCGTGRDLNAVAISSDGAAAAAGGGRVVLWRPPGGELRAIPPPPVATDTDFAGVSIPSADRIWLVSGRGGGTGPASERGAIWAGTLEDGNWIWRLEHKALAGGATWQLRGIALDERRHGYAVGDAGTIFERSADGSWKQLPSPYPNHNLTSVSLPIGGGPGALIGGENRLILTQTARGFEVARPPDYRFIERTSTLAVTEIVATAIVPGVGAQQAEAWALGAGSAGTSSGASRLPANNSLLHYASNEAEPLARPSHRARPLRDSPIAARGELVLAAFGKSDCQNSPVLFCPPWQGGGAYEEVVTQRITDELAARSRAGSPPAAALFTGDAVDAGGYHANQATESSVDQAPLVGGSPIAFSLTAGNDEMTQGPAKLRRWGEAVDRLSDAGVAVFGSVGAQDVSTWGSCAYSQAVSGEAEDCLSTKQYAKQGENLSWRHAAALRPKPWGAAVQPAASRYVARRAGLGALSVRVPNADTPALEQPSAERSRRVPTGGADTHYAIDLLDREQGGEPVARLVFLDNSQGSLAASDPLQQPVEPDGQLGFLERMLCLKGQVSTTQRCSRRPGQRAIVVMNAPTYSYGPGTGTETAADGAAVEAVLLRHKVSLVVSGRIGWNGLYWTSTPGIHDPCPGGSYPSEPPSGRLGICGRTGPADPTQLAQGGDLAAVLEQATTPTGELTGIDPGGLGRPVPFVVASGAGGRFADGAEADQGEAKNGYWHGYSIARLDPTGNTRQTIVEQRPVYDFVGIEAQEHTLRPGQRMTLRGFGRGPVGFRATGSPFGVFAVAQRILRFDRIDSAAVTHRYALVEADPERPWLPKRNEEGGYAELDPSVATVDPHTGVVKAGKGSHPRTFAIGVLSVGCGGADADPGTGLCSGEEEFTHSAAWPLLFEPRRTFKPVVVAQPRVTQRAASAGATLPPPPSAPPASTAVQPLNLPPPPNAPALPPIDVPQVNPPSPPVPPPPPLQQSPVPLDLSASAPGVTIAPQTTVIPPPAPPIQPAPPGGARREARQRQSATQSSGSGSETAGSSGSQLDAGDSANSPMGPQGSAMTRADRARADGGSMTAYYGASVTLLALVAAFGWNYGRPGPRRRSPIEAAPARAWTRRR